MENLKRNIATAVVLAALAAFVSASSWEGSAMMGSYGDFPSSGYFAACNSFPRNTSVEVVNLETGRSVTAIVTKGLESSGVFMILSVEAAGALGLESGRVARVRVSEPRSAIELAPASGARTSFDPDLNPRLFAAQELRRMGYELEPGTARVVEPKPAVSSPRASPAASPAPDPYPTEPSAPAAEAPPPVPEVAPVAAGPAAAETAAVAEPPLAPRPATSPALAVVEPEPVASADILSAPEALSSAKPRPVRTIVLPQLPEPSAAPVAEAPVAPAMATLAEAPKPDVVSMLLPVPDETPLRVEASAAPRRYEAPTVRPEASTARSGTPAGPGVSIAMFEPAPPSEAQVEAYALSSPASLSGGLSSALADPSYPDSVAAAAESPASLAAEPESAVAFERVVPSWSLGGTELALDWPELEADELPATFLSMLPSPAMTIPATSLAEGEIILPHGDGPSALALETPSLGAAETVVALEDAEAEPEETPLAVASTRLEPSAEADSYALAEAEAVKPDTAGPLAEERLAGEPVDSSGSAGLAEAAETKPETAPIVESPAEDGAPAVALEPPREYIVALEPADAKPPVAPAATAPEKPATAPETLATAPAATATKPIVPHAIATPAATVMGALEKGRYYIQIGAFATEMAAKDALARLGGFVTLVQKTSDKGKDTFRVFVGPLSRDESGVALVRVRSLGYKDAFLKTGG